MPLHLDPFMNLSYIQTAFSFRLPVGAYDYLTSLCSRTVVCGSQSAFPYKNLTVLKVLTVCQVESLYQRPTNSPHNLLNPIPSFPRPLLL
jgi:hypothetical protein